MSASLLLSLVFLGLFGAALGGFVVSRKREKDRKLARRFSAGLNVYARSGPAQNGPTPLLALPLTSRTLMSFCARIFGFRPTRLDLYPASPWIVIIVVLAAAWFVAWVLELIVGPAGVLAVPALWVFLGRRVFGRYHTKRTTILFQQFPDALAMIVRAVRVGIPITESIRAVARENEPPTAGEFARLADQIAIGLPLDEALRSMAERNGLAEYRFFATALSLQSQTGGNLSETLDNLADVIRKRVAARARGYALAAEARLSSNVLAALPVLLFIALWFMNPGYVGTLLSSHAGHMILGATLVMLGGGMFVMRLLIQKSLS